MARLLLLLFLAAAVALGEDIPLQDCDKLPVVQVSVAGKTFLFLVDTAATSMLNLGSFAHGDALNISVTSWSGTAVTRAQEVTVGELVLGDHHFKISSSRRLIYPRLATRADGPLTGFLESTCCGNGVLRSI